MREKNKITDFSSHLLAWHELHGRHDLPWQHEITPYRVWISEIMLQQTQVHTVIPYFNAFMQRFPDVRTLATAGLDEVLHYWTGLGYYARARNLYRAAQIVVNNHQGKIPVTLEQLMGLPGIGRSTAGAILALACGQRHPILDGNAKRVFARFHAVSGWPGQPAVASRLWSLAEAYTPPSRVAEYTQAIMDLGATICNRRQPRCGDCPVRTGCQARRKARQHDFPGARPGRKLPVRRTVFTILQNEAGQVLLEQRPLTGIWGGLWAFPECAPGEDVAAWIGTRFGCTINGLEYMAERRHTFTHFHLDIVPVHALVADGGAAFVEAGRYCWYGQGARQRFGMAAPVRTLLDGIMRNPRE